MNDTIKNFDLDDLPVTRLGPPPWDEAPDWADAVAMTEGGQWWWSGGGVAERAGYFGDKDGRDSDETFERRPVDTDDDWTGHISPCVDQPTGQPTAAEEILCRARQHMRDRAKTYDQPQGERSMGATVRAFFEITGDGAMDSEERGWLFMELLKCVRSQQGEYRADNYEDATAYAALRGESAVKERA